MTVNPERISRRTMLKGAGALLSLPLLEAMTPNFARAAEAAVKRPMRMAALYFANGVNVNEWTPKGNGKAFELSPSLAPLAKLKSDILVLDELMNIKTDTGDGHYV